MTAPPLSLRLLLAAGIILLGGAAVHAADTVKPDAPAEERQRSVTLDELKPQLEAGGLKGTMHGANHQQGTYVFTWRNPRDFFNFYDFSLIPGGPEVTRVLDRLDRHQVVMIKGRIVPEIGPQPHILVTEITPGEKWESGVTAAHGRPAATDLRRSLAGKKMIHGMVHAVGEDGGLLVLEWRNGILPVLVPGDPGVRQKVGTLYRGDKVDLRFQVQQAPGQPVHVLIDGSPKDGKEPVTVTDRLETLDGKTETVEGNLVLFPKSPSLTRSIWGVERKNADGLHWYFTIFNFEDLKDQEQIETALQSAWSREPRGITDARNKFVNTRVRVRVTGKINNPSKNQANPTLMTDSTRVTVISPRE